MPNARVTAKRLAYLRAVAREGFYIERSATADHCRQLGWTEGRVWVDDQIIRFEDMTARQRTMPRRGGAILTDAGRAILERQG